MPNKLVRLTSTGPNLTTLQYISAVLLLSLSASSASAALKLNGIFGDHMILQRDMKVPVWGWADPGQSITVSFGSHKQTATADAAGKWTATLDPMSANSQGQDLVVSAGSENLKCTDVLVGEVWLCSGQSNMEWALARSDGGPEAVEKSDNPLLRLCVIPHNSQLTPQEDAQAKWAISSPKSTRTFSAIGWWMGSKLQKTLGIPVGIVASPYGGTAIQAWIPLDSLRTLPLPKDRFNDRDVAKADYDQRYAKMKPVMDKYLADKAQAIQDKQPLPTFPVGWPGDFRGPGVLWNGMVAPFVKFPVRGVAWYQGENNCYLGPADTYATLLPILIRDWRNAMGQSDLPFIIFQVAPNRKPQTDPNEMSGIAVVQDAQARTAIATPHTVLVVTMDLGVPDVHYHRKEPAADRAVAAAMYLAYGSKTDPWSPMFDKADFQNGQVIVHYTHTAGGLVALDNGVPAEKVIGFVICGDDGKFVFADARVDGETVIVSSPQVPHPTAIRYGWADLPTVNLFNKSGLPASPFRTDNYPTTQTAAPAAK
jgi:sialate O-acetylesterase